MALGAMMTHGSHRGLRRLPLASVCSGSFLEILCTCVGPYGPRGHGRDSTFHSACMRATCEAIFTCTLENKKGLSLFLLLRGKLVDPACK